MVALAAFRERRLSSWREGTCLLDLANTGDCSEDRPLQGSMNAIRQDPIGSLNGGGVLGPVKGGTKGGNLFGRYLMRVQLWLARRCHMSRHLVSVGWGLERLV